MPVFKSPGDIEARSVVVHEQRWLQKAEVVTLVRARVRTVDATMELI